MQLLLLGRYLRYRGRKLQRDVRADDGGARHPPEAARLLPDKHGANSRVLKSSIEGSRTPPKWGRPGAPALGPLQIPAPAKIDIHLSVIMTGGSEEDLEAFRAGHRQSSVNIASNRLLQCCCCGRRGQETRTTPVIYFLACQAFA